MKCFAVLYIVSCGILVKSGPFENEIVVRINGGHEMAKIIAREKGYHYRGPVRDFKNTYIFTPMDDGSYPAFRKRDMDITKSDSDERIVWAEEQKIKHRFKRDFLVIPKDPLFEIKQSFDNSVGRKEYPFDENDVQDLGRKRVYGSYNFYNLPRHQNIKNTQSDKNYEFYTNLWDRILLNMLKTKNDKSLPQLAVQEHPRTSRYKIKFNDDLWGQEWYLQDTRTRSDLPKLDLNVLPVYAAGITGKGVRISIIDDGIEYTHDDLKANYDPDISYDCNEEDDDPMPRYDESKVNSHGTRCAGEIAMSANNSKCGVGIAYNARVGGVKLLDGIVNDRIEGTALRCAQDLVDIYSASWGPYDDGKSLEGPGTLAREAMEDGIKYGRNGKGSIYVWASGNGGSTGDNCNCDGYLTTPYTISIGSASQKGEFPWYGEECASTLAVTYSSGAYKDQMIATTDLQNNCTIKHTGTSASAPLAAGIIALALEVNPNLTWRDVQHLIVWTSELAPIKKDPRWQQNAAGFWFNTRFGFGLMNAWEFVQNAANWTNVPPRRTCSVSTQKSLNLVLSYGQPVTLTINTLGCENNVRYLEHVEVVTNIDYNIRGVLEVFLMSPSGTTVQLLSTRKNDYSDEGFKNWSFMSVMTWGEDPSGIWTFKVSDSLGPLGNVGRIGQIHLHLHGTMGMPEHMRNGPRSYNNNYL